MRTAVKHPVPDRVKPSFVIFDIRALSSNRHGYTVDLNEENLEVYVEECHDGTGKRASRSYVGST